VSGAARAERKKRERSDHTGKRLYVLSFPPFFPFQPGSLLPSFAFCDVLREGCPLLKGFFFCIFFSRFRLATNDIIWFKGPGLFFFFFYAFHARR
jgi:hypothetical protein